MPRSPGRRRNPVRPNVNETVITNDIPVVLTPGGNEPYCPSSPIPPGRPEGFPSIPPYIPPVLGGIDLDSILRGLGIESFPGVLGGLDDLFIPYFDISTDDPIWDQVESDGFYDPVIDSVVDAVNHILETNPGRLRELGVDKEGLKDLIDYVYTNGQPWSRPYGKTFVNIYVGADGFVFINNPANPTFYKPDDLQKLLEDAQPGER